MSSLLPLPEGGRVLVVDDNPAARYAKARVLQLAGFSVMEGATGSEALAMIALHHPEVLVLDVRLPDFNGRTISTQLKSNPATSDITILQTSATHVDVRHKVLALEAGADAYLAEPAEPEELIANVRALLRLHRAEAELRALDRRKDEFLAMLAHELRNPLGPIRNAVEILRITPSENVEIHGRAREMIARQVTHMGRLVDDLLDVSRISQGKILLQRAPTRLNNLVAAALELARPLTDSSGHEVVVHQPKDDVWLDVDPVRMTQVVGNLVNNAAKFTPPGGRITVTAEVTGDDTVILVDDSGIGIAAEVLPHVFELFVQGDISLERTRGGLGVGLSLVHHLVEMHGGHVTAESGGAGQGSRFRVALPGLRREASTVASAAAGVTTGQHRILVVDDSRDSAEALAEVLALKGHQVATAFGAREALATARVFLPEIVFLDIGLPEMDGYQLAKLMRQQPETAKARLLALTGYGQRADRDRALEAGFNEHLVKPFDPALLDRVIEGA